MVTPSARGGMMRTTQMSRHGWQGAGGSFVVWAAAWACSGASSPPARAEVAPVTLEVQFKLTDLDYKAVAGVPVRVAFGAPAAWQSPESGTKFVTGATGEFTFSATAPIEPESKTRPTNFADSLTARPEPTDHLTAAVELPYMTFRWLYVVEIWRFQKSGDVLTQGITLYTRDPSGRFTRKAERQKDGGWVIADLNGLLLTAPGHEVWSNLLEPPEGNDPSSPWRLRLAFKQYPPPIQTAGPGRLAPAPSQRPRDEKPIESPSSSYGDRSPRPVQYREEHGHGATATRGHTGSGADIRSRDATRRSAPESRNPENVHVTGQVLAFHGPSEFSAIGGPGPPRMGRHGRWRRADRPDSPR